VTGSVEVVIGIAGVFKVARPQDAPAVDQVVDALKQRSRISHDNARAYLFPWRHYRPVGMCQLRSCDGAASPERLAQKWVG